MTSALQTIPSETTAAELRSVAANERIDLVDIVRGFALYGVLLANLVWITTDVVLTDARLAQLPTAPLDRVVKPLVVFFVDHKFYTLFSFLFGLGFAIQLSRADERGRAVTSTYARRVGILAAIGLVHISVLWYGDILLIYGLCGLVLLLVRQWNVRVLLVLAFVLALFARAAVGAYPLLVGQPARTNAGAAMQGDAEKERELAVFDSASYRAIAAENRTYFYQQIVVHGIGLFLLPQVFARFLLGLYVGRRQWAHRTAELVPSLRRLLPWSGVLAVAGTSLMMYVKRLQHAGVVGLDSYWVHASAVVEEAGVLAMSFCYLSTIVLLFHGSTTWRRRLGHLAPVGRMALTNYLTHSLLYLVLFTGVGLGLYGEVGPTLCLVFSVVIFSAQMAFSRWWLSHYRFGPAEWVWRTLTYGQLQPMRIQAWVATAVVVLLATTAIVRSQTPGASPLPVAITNVTVIDTVSGGLRPDMTVVVTGDRIAEVGPAGRVRVVESAQRLDGRGKFLIPGLWDMHVHGLTPGPASVILPLLVANGVTGIRQMSDPLPAMATVRREMSRLDGGFPVAPRVGAWAGTDLIGPIPPGGLSFTVAPLVVATPEEGRAAVDKVLASGADFVKVRDHLGSDTYRTILQHARQRNVPVAGHVPYEIDVRTASDLGQRSIEHMAGIPVACSSDEHLIRREMPTLLQQTLGSAPAVDTALMQRTANTFDGTKCLALGRHLAKNGTWAAPTLSVFNPERVARMVGRAERPLERYMPADALEYWRQARSRDPISAAAPDRLDRYFQALLAMVAALHNAGVGVLVGTDSPITQVYPGFSVHEELALFVTAGLTPAQALRTATLAPARFLGREHEFGTIETGKFADLVLLDANPLTAIGNTTRINAVVASGRLYRRPDLDDLLAKVEAAANK